MSTKPAASISARMIETICARVRMLRCIFGAAQVEPAVADAQGLVDVLLVELERQRLRARDDLELVDLQLDLAGRQVRVDGLGRARGDLAFGAEDELVADAVRDLGRFGRALGVDHKLREAALVSQVDEHEPAVVAAACGPARKGEALPDVLLARARPP